MLMTASHFIQEPWDVNDYSWPGSLGASPGDPLPGEVLLMAFFANSSPPPVSLRDWRTTVSRCPKELLGFP